MSTTSTELKWQDPPAAPRGRAGNADYDGIVEGLKGQPGRWALVSEQVKTPSGAWKARGAETRAVGTETPEGRRFDVYARWPEGEAETAIE